jgi:predicted nucleic acid-binding protein
MSALRKLAAAGLIDAGHAEAYVANLAALPAERYSHLDLLGRMWELRHNFTAYDAAYVALAERLNATLYTTDKKLLRGHRARAVLAQESLPH